MSPEASAAVTTPAGERRQLTVLFCDLVGSTEIASQLDPEEWHSISKDYQQAAAAAVTRFGGHVDKFLGDSLVCFFGVPQAHEEAIGQLLLQAQPAGAERDARELSVQLALGSSLIAARGYAHAETAVAYERATAVATAVDDAAQPGRARIGLGVCYYTRGEVERGRALVAQVLAKAEARGNGEQALFGHTQLAMPEYAQGKFASSLAHCERAIALYENATTAAASMIPLGTWCPNHGTTRDTGELQS